MIRNCYWQWLCDGRNLSGGVCSINTCGYCCAIVSSVSVSIFLDWNSNYIWFNAPSFSPPFIYVCVWNCAILKLNHPSIATSVFVYIFHFFFLFSRIGLRIHSRRLTARAIFTKLFRSRSHSPTVKKIFLFFLYSSASRFFFFLFSLSWYNRWARLFIYPRNIAQYAMSIEVK